MSHTFRATRQFWKSFDRLPAAQQDSARAKWRIFSADPFDPRLGAHKINSLSAAAGRTVYAVKIEGDLRSVFYVEGSTVISFDIGTHKIYRG